MELNRCFIIQRWALINLIIIQPLKLHSIKLYHLLVSLQGQTNRGYRYLNPPPRKDSNRRGTEESGDRRWWSSPARRVPFDSRATAWRARVTRRCFFALPLPLFPSSPSFRFLGLIPQTRVSSLGFLDNDATGLRKLAQLASVKPIWFAHCSD